VETAELFTWVAAGKCAERLLEVHFGDQVGHPGHGRYVEPAVVLFQSHRPSRPERSRILSITLMRSCISGTQRGPECCVARRLRTELHPRQPGDHLALGDQARSCVASRLQVCISLDLLPGPLTHARACSLASMECTGPRKGVGILMGGFGALPCAIERGAASNPGVSGVELPGSHRRARMQPSVRRAVERQAAGQRQPTCLPIVLALRACLVGAQGWDRQS
jgi:hypothetical protein